jgi:hypothetical protein
MSTACPGASLWRRAQQNLASMTSCCGCAQSGAVNCRTIAASTQQRLAACLYCSGCEHAVWTSTSTPPSALSMQGSCRVCSTCAQSAVRFLYGAAAEAGNVEMLRWLQLQRCPWDSSAVSSTASFIRQALEVARGDSGWDSHSEAVAAAGIGAMHWLHQQVPTALTAFTSNCH